MKGDRVREIEEIYKSYTDTQIGKMSKCVEATGVNRSQVNKKYHYIFSLSVLFTTILQQMQIKCLNEKNFIGSQINFFLIKCKVPQQCI